MRLHDQEKVRESERNKKKMLTSSEQLHRLGLTHQDLM